MTGSSDSAWTGSKFTRRTPDSPTRTRPWCRPIWSLPVEFGNVTDEDVATTVAALPQLCAANATVLWTRHRRRPDLTPSINDWFANAGFEQLRLYSPDRNGFAVGTHRLVGDPQPLRSGERWFSFDDQTGADGSR
jgi:hypothetical protein